MSLKITNNCLFDIIHFLNQGHIVCMHENNSGIYYHKYEILSHITQENLIYIDFTKNPRLMDSNEYPWYIINAGFTEYKSTHILPINPDKIHQFAL
jgi:hypothetical protein